MLKFQVFYNTHIGIFYLGASNQCFYKPGTGANNPFSKIVGLLNTGAQIVTGATLGGRKGEHFKASMFVVHIVRVSNFFLLWDTNFYTDLIIFVKLF